MYSRKINGAQDNGTVLYPQLATWFVNSRAYNLDDPLLESRKRSVKNIISLFSSAQHGSAEDGEFHLWKAEDGELDTVENGRRRIGSLFVRSPSECTH